MSRVIEVNVSVDLPNIEEYIRQAQYDLNHHDPPITTSSKRITFVQNYSIRYIEEQQPRYSESQSFKDTVFELFLNEVVFNQEEDTSTLVNARQDTSNTKHSITALNEVPPVNGNISQNPVISFPSPQTTAHAISDNFAFYQLRNEQTLALQRQQQMEMMTQRLQMQHSHAQQQCFFQQGVVAGIYQNQSHLPMKTPLPINPNQLYLAMLPPKPKMIKKNKNDQNNKSITDKADKPKKYGELDTRVECFDVYCTHQGSDAVRLQVEKLFRCVNLKNNPMEKFLKRYPINKPDRVYLYCTCQEGITIGEKHIFGFFRNKEENPTLYEGWCFGELKEACEKHLVRREQSSVNSAADALVGLKQNQSSKKLDQNGRGQLLLDNENVNNVEPIADDYGGGVVMDDDYIDEDEMGEVNEVDLLKRKAEELQNENSFIMDCVERNTHMKLAVNEIDRPETVKAKEQDPFGDDCQNNKDRLVNENTSDSNTQMTTDKGSKGQYADGTGNDSINQENKKTKQMILYSSNDECDIFDTYGSLIIGFPSFLGKENGSDIADVAFAPLNAMQARYLLDIEFPWTWPFVGSIVQFINWDYCLNGQLNNCRIMFYSEKQKPDYSEFNSLNDKITEVFIVYYFQEVDTFEHFILLHINFAKKHKGKIAVNIYDSLDPSFFNKTKLEKNI